MLPKSRQRKLSRSEVDSLIPKVYRASNIVSSRVVILTHWIDLEQLTLQDGHLPFRNFSPHLVAISVASSRQSSREISPLLQEMRHLDMPDTAIASVPVYIALIVE
jgi:hypothetical protein